MFFPLLLLKGVRFYNFQTLIDFKEGNCLIWELTRPRPESSDNVFKAWTGPSCKKAGWKWTGRLIKRLRELPEFMTLRAATSCQPSYRLCDSGLTSSVKFLLSFSITWEKERNVQISDWTVLQPTGVGSPGQYRTSQERPWAEECQWVSCSPKQFRFVCPKDVDLRVSETERWT